jgi:GNAT superfamily N-acetyltransferase
MPRIPSCTEAAPPAGLTIRPVRDEAGLRDFSQTVGAAFELPPEQSAQLIPGMAVALDPDIGLFVGTLDGRAVATGMLYRVDGVTAITGMATLPPYRGRGFGAALLWAALAEGVRRGSTEAALRSGPLSVPLYRRLGFLPACQHRTYVASEPGTR